MGCASSGPAKDLAAAATNGTAAQHVKGALNNAMEDAANLDFAKAEEDLKQVGEGLKDAIKEGVNDVMEGVMGKRPSSMEGREDGDGGSMKENNNEDASAAENTEGVEEESAEPSAEEKAPAEDGGGEPGLDSIPQEAMEEAAEAMGVEGAEEKGGGEAEATTEEEERTTTTGNANIDEAAAGGATEE